MENNDYTNPKKRWMMLLGGITIHTDLFENKKEIEERFPFVFHDMLYGKRACADEWNDDVSGSEGLITCAFSSLIGQIVHRTKGDGTYERIKIEKVYINYWCQICAHGELVEEDTTSSAP